MQCHIRVKIILLHIFLGGGGVHDEPCRRELVAGPGEAFPAFWEKFPEIFTDLNH